MKQSLGQKVKQFYKKNKTKIWVVTTFVSTMVVSRKIYKTADEIQREEDVMVLDDSYEIESENDYTELEELEELEEVEEFTEEEE